MIRVARASFVLATLLLLTGRSFASDLTVNGAAGATVTFSAVGNTLTVTLSNQATTDPSQPMDILTGVFFNIDKDPSLTKVSAVICGTCKVTDGGSTDAGGSVGGEWAYKSSSTGLLYGDNYGISSTGLSIFGPGDLFGGTNLAGTPGPGGLEYGITTKTDTPGNDNGGLSGVPLISYQVLFTLSGLPSGFDPSRAISGVTFQYGTAPVPEPTSLALIGVGAVSALAVRRRKRKTTQD